MANRKMKDGTLFMALEVGAIWPTRISDLKCSDTNVQAVVQDNGETAEHFAGRALEKWHQLLDTSAPPFRFMLGTRPNPDDGVMAARERIARGAFEYKAQVGPSELILWSGTAANSEEQNRLLALAGMLLENHGGPERSVRVLFGDTCPSLLRGWRTRTRLSGAGADARGGADFT